MDLQLFLGSRMPRPVSDAMSCSADVVMDPTPCAEVPYPQGVHAINMDKVKIHLCFQAEASKYGQVEINDDATFP